MAKILYLTNHLHKDFKRPKIAQIGATGGQEWRSYGQTEGFTPRLIWQGGPTLNSDAPGLGQPVQLAFQKAPVFWGGIVQLCLFSLYINDLGRDISEGKGGAMTGDGVNGIVYMLYADDLSLTTNDLGEMQVE
eukprot:1143892-Pelagomonas_calceolata.AAC.4